MARMLIALPALTRAAVAGMLLLLSPAVAADDCQPEWIPTFGQGTAGVDPTLAGPDAHVWRLIELDDGSGAGPHMYAVGDFTTISGVTANGIAAWSNGAWRPLPGVASGIINTVALHDDGSGLALYVGGSFGSIGGVTANNIARWDGTTWHALGAGTNGPVFALQSFNDGTGAALFVGGQFTDASGTMAQRVARWKSGSWLAAGLGLTGGEGRRVRCFKIHDDGSGTGPALYAGGDFSQSGAANAKCIARWTGSGWVQPGAGIAASSGGVYSLVSYHDGTNPSPVLVASGDFFNAGGQPVFCVASWNGSAWSRMDAGLNVNSQVFGMSVAPNPAGTGADVLAFGGIVSDTGTTDHPFDVCLWNGASWVKIGGGPANTFLPNWDVFTVHWTHLVGDGLQLVAAGSFMEMNGIPFNRIARWDGADWKPVGSGLKADAIHAVVFDDGRGGGPALYACSRLGNDPDEVAGRIVRWNGSSWEPILGFDKQVNCLCVFDDGSGPKLIAGGTFLNAPGGVAANSIAAWDGRVWTALGGGLAGEVLSMAQFVHNGQPALFCGGEFLQGGVGIRRWSAGSWAPASNLNGKVHALTIHDDGTGPTLYAGGEFVTAAGVTINRVGRWNGTQWKALGTGVNATVRSLASYENPVTGVRELYVGGDFTQASGLPVNGIARWNGSAWSSVGDGVQQNPTTAGTATCMRAWQADAANPPVLMVAGQFDLAGGQAAQRIAVWDGDSWSNAGGWLGPSVSNNAAGIAKVFVELPSHDLVVAGSFATSSSGDGYVALLRQCDSQPAPQPDINQDGFVDGTDLGLLLSQWGPCTGCSADLNSDDLVDGSDLGILLGAWDASP